MLGFSHAPVNGKSAILGSMLFRVWFEYFVVRDCIVGGPHGLVRCTSGIDRTEVEDGNVLVKLLGLFFYIFPKIMVLEELGDEHVVE